jgi:hypothetical protein
MFLLKFVGGLAGHGSHFERGPYARSAAKAVTSSAIDSEQRLGWQLLPVLTEEFDVGVKQVNLP